MSDSSGGFPPRSSQILLIVICAAFIAHAIWLACVAEDSYITYRFARNVAEGHGFVWNVGGPAIEGFTNFLWLQLCVAALKLELDPARATQIVGLAAGVGTLLVIWLFARRALAMSLAGALFTVATLAAAGPLAAWATSGMETVFFAFCVVCAVYGASRFLSSARSQHAMLTASALVAATLTRPEGFGIAGIVLTVMFALSANRRQRQWALVVAAAYMLAFSVYFAWRYATFGYPLPNTFYAKTGGGPTQYWRGLVYLVFFAFHFLVPWIPWVILFVWHAGQPSRLAGAPRMTTSISTDQRAAGLVVAGAVITGYLGYVVAVGGDYMAMYRFIVPVVPLLFVVLGLCADAAIRNASMSIARQVVVAAMALVTVGGLLLQSTRYEKAVFAQTPRMHGTYRGVETERWYVNRFHVIARFFSHEMPDQSGSILTWDIGVVGYDTRFTIHDALGIVDPVIAHSRPDATIGEGLAGHEKQDLRYSYSLQPTFVMYTVQLRPAPADWPRLPPDLAAHVHAEYELKSAWLTDSRNNEAGYFTYLQRKR